MTPSVIARLRSRLSLLVMLLLLPCVLWAQELPSSREITQRLNELEKKEALTTLQQDEQVALKETLVLLESIDLAKKQIASLQKRVDKLPEELRKIDRNLEQDGDSLDNFSAQLDILALNELESLQTQSLLELQTLQQKQGTLNSQMTNLQTLPERAQTRMGKAYQCAQEIRVSLNDDDKLTPSRKVVLQTEQALIDLQLKQLQIELDNRAAMQELAAKQRDYLGQQLHQEERKLELLQQSISSKRLGDTKKSAEEHAESALSQNSPLLQREQSYNQQLSQQLIKATSNLNLLIQKNLEAKSWLERGTQIERNLNEQVQLLKGNLLLSRILYQLYQQLDSAPINTVKNLDEQIADLHLAQFELSQNRDQLFQKNVYLDKLITASNSEVSKAERKELLNLLDTRSYLFDQLNQQLDSQLTTAISLQLTQQQIKQIYDAIEFTLQQHIFWVSSNKPVDTKWVLSWPSQVLNQILDRSRSPDWREWRNKLLPISLAVVPILLLAGVIHWRRGYLNKRLEKLNKELGRFTKDSQWHTPTALLIAAVLRLPGSLVIFALGLLFTYSGFYSERLMFQLAINMSLGYLMFGLYLDVMSPGGIAERHFRITKGELDNRYGDLNHLWIPLLLLIFFSTKAVVEPSALGGDIIGMTAVMVLFAISAWVIFPLLKTRFQSDEKDDNFIQNILAFALALTPIALIILTLLGYYYTAMKLTGRFIETFYLLLLWSLIYRTALRGLQLAARRLAWRRAMAKREQQQKGGEDTEGTDPTIEDRTMAIEDVSQQSLRLTRIALMAIFGFAFYWLWSDLVAIIAYLDSIVLWHNTVGSGAEMVLVPVSLGDLLSAVITISAIWILARNLPGLLEVLILSRLRMAQGSTYAITTMLNYVLLGGGALISLSILGIQWDKLQWLAAALTVGIGFGLQEIVANFVSGIIILFERPVRIGDTITLGEFSGTVSKIRIRATTITDFDRREVIIPNKAFVTERLNNWSLSDTVTRVVLRIGVAYGSDLELTKKLLRQVAEENPRVLKDPEPLIFFLAFGASTLDHELRFFVEDLADRNPALDEMNRRIDQLFRENGIEIAFPQMDVHIRSHVMDTNK